MAFSVRIAIFFLFSIFLHFYFSIYIVQLLLKFYDFFKNILHNAIHLNYWCRTDNTYLPRAAGAQEVTT